MKNIFKLFLLLIFSNLVSASSITYPPTIGGVGGVGDVVGPASSTDNAVVRFDLTTGKLLKNSVVTIGNTGATTGITTLGVSGQATFSLDPANTTESSASVYINPATSALNEKFLTIADNGTAVFTVDKEGDTLTEALYSRKLYGIGNPLQVGDGSPTQLGSETNDFFVTGVLEAGEYVYSPNVLAFEGLFSQGPLGVNGAVSLLGTVTTNKTNAAGESAEAFVVAPTLGIMNGSDTYDAYLVNVTNSNHTGASNAVNGLHIKTLTNGADADAVETAIKIDASNWDIGIDAGDRSIVTTGTLSSGAATLSSVSSSGTITSTKANAAGGSAEAMFINPTLGIMDGSDVYDGLGVLITNANHTGASNQVNGLSLNLTAGDADATETAVRIGSSGWDVAIEAGDLNINNVGAIAVDTINADATTVDYNDVNILELTQADLAVGSCTLGQIRLDTGGATKELCYCEATNSWVCTTMATGPTD